MALQMKRSEVLNLFMKGQVKYKAFAYTLALDWAVADDAVQEAAVFVCDHYEEFELGTNFDAWARAIIRNRCREIFRREHNERKKAKRVEMFLPDMVWDEVEHFEQDKLLALRTCLESVPKQTKQIVNMFYGEKKKCDVISIAIQMSEDAVYKILSRVRKSLKICVESKLKEA